MSFRDARYTIGIDTGGTFTDAVLLTPSGELVTGKSATTPDDFSRGVINAVGELASQLSLTLDELLARTAFFKHGTTVATNALITRTGAQVGFITTRGFEDTPLIMRTIGRVDGLPEEEIRHVTSVTKPEPLVPRERIRGVSERVDYTGDVIVPLQMADVDRAVHDLVEEQGCGAIGVSLMHAWANPVHENAIRTRVQQLYPDGQVFWSFGSDLSRVAGEYARGNTTIANSFVGPTVQRYLGDLESTLRDHGLQGSFLVMQGNGGLAGREQTNPIGVLQSGPAGGMIAAAYMADLLGHTRVLTTDMGGTSFDVSIIADGFWSYAEEPIFDRFRIRQPIADIQSIGAGGGTIARVDEVTNRLLVGPQSAGASPGPVCYDQGGEQVTITDADVLLGYVDPSYFLGGRTPLRKDRAEEAMDQRIAQRLGLPVADAAAGIYQIINSKMSDLIRRQIVRSGYLPEDFVLYAFGGAGPVHAAGYARELGIQQIYVFPTSPVFSAFGAATADIVHSNVMTYQVVMPLDVQQVNDRLASVEADLMNRMVSESFGAEQVTFRRFVSMRFQRQTYGVELPVPWDRLDGAKVGELGKMFLAKYEELYGEGSAYKDAKTEIFFLRIDAVGQVPKPVLTRADVTAGDARSARKGSRPAYFEGGFVETDVYAYEQLGPGAELAGPAIVEAALTTIVVPPGYAATLDGYRNVVLVESQRLNETGRLVQARGSAAGRM